MPLGSDAAALRIAIGDAARFGRCSPCRYGLPLDIFRRIRASALKRVVV